MDGLTAAWNVVDDAKDGGIDATDFDRPRTRCVLMQAKFKRSRIPPEQAENRTIPNGVRMHRRRVLFHAPGYITALVSRRSAGTLCGRESPF
jgi:hypothetical protein